MRIERIELHHFRNYETLSLFPHEGINIFFGQNGSGKTNLLEAIHYCSLGRSHRINQDVNAVMVGAPGASCHLYLSGRLAKHEIEVKLRPGEETVKSVWIDQKRAARLSEMMGVLRCVIFSPEDLDLIKEGPSVRRRFLDMMISQLSRSYFVSLQQYRIAMNQRNAILKQAKLENQVPDPMIVDFEAAMAEHAKVIYVERMKYTEILSAKCQELYRKISGKETETFTVFYRPSTKEPQMNTEIFQELLRKIREDDLRQASTSIGPQRDDLHLSLNGKSMKQFASQGQMRTGALSLKLAQLDIYHQMTGEQPVLLLDDVMSELDLKRRMNLLNMIEGIQTFITCSDEGDLADQNYRTYEVRSLDGKAELTEMKQGSEKQQYVLKEPVFD